MNKEIFNYLYSFKYKNNNYIFITSKNYPFYFLEYDLNKNTFSYPKIEIFKDLFEKYNSNEIKLFNDIKTKLTVIKEKLKETKFTINPLVKTTSGLLSVAVVLSMCGCTQTKRNKETAISPTTTFEQQSSNSDIYNYFKEYNIEIINRRYDENDYIFVKDFINKNGKHQITISDFNEFKKYKNLSFDPTYDNVIDSFNNNKNIDNNIKEIIINGINMMKKSEELKNLDLSVLYINSKKMNIKYISSDEIINETQKESTYAYFETTTGTIYLPDDKPLKEFEILHEALGHGSLAFREENEDSMMVFDCTNYLMLPTDDRYTGNSVGITISEGGANKIARIATNNKTASTFYELYEEELRVISELCNVSIGELFNHKGISFYDLMYKNNINTPIEYIFKMDALYKGQLYCEFSYLMEKLFVDATEENYIKSDKKVQKQILKDTIKIIRNSNFKEKKELNFEYNQGTSSINYNFNDAANNYEKEMNKLNNTKK